MRLWPFPGSPPKNPKHIEDRLKLIANALQALALALIVASLIAPAVSPTTAKVDLSTSLGAGILAGIALVAAHAFLRYIPYDSDKGS